MEKPVDKYNIMVIGDENVGKTTILERYFNRKFNSERKKTIGVEYYLKSYTQKEKNLLYNLKFWDTAGQEKFQSVTRNYYQRSHGMLITMAINIRSSFSNLKMWINSIYDGSSLSDLPIVVICNKCDLEDQRQVSNNEIEKFCKEEKLKVFFTSAKNGSNIDEAFDYIINKVIDKNSSNSNSKKSRFELKDDLSDKSTSNCGC